MSQAQGGKNAQKRGHGGNPELIRYFIQTRLEKARPYAVYFFEQAGFVALLKDDASA